MCVVNTPQKKEKEREREKTHIEVNIHLKQERHPKESTQTYVFRFSLLVFHTQKKQNCKGKRWEWSRWRRKTRKWTTSYGRAKKIMPAKVGFRSRGLQIVPRRINYESDALPTELPRLWRYKSELSLTWMVFLFKPYSWKYMFLNTTPQTRQPFFSAVSRFQKS